MIVMVIDSIRVNLTNYQRVVILKENDSSRILPIWIGPAEADAIAVKLHNVELARPLAHDLIHSVITALGAELDHVVVSDLQQDTFYAKLVLIVNGQKREVDSRPSDALALAVRAEVPIYAEEAVLAKAGLTLEEDTAKPQEHIDEQEREKLSAFEDFISELNLEDFKRRNS